MNEQGSRNPAVWIVGAAAIALVVWWNIGMPGLRIKSGVYECKDSGGEGYIASVLDRDIQGFGRLMDGQVITVGHKSIQRATLSSSTVFKMAIEGGDTVKCTWVDELPLAR